MKRILLLALTLICVAGMASADVGQLGVFADTEGTSCDITDVPYASMNAYILHYNATSANTSQFSVFVDPNMTALSGAQTVNPAFLSLGSLENGIAITYVGCKTTFPLLLATMSWVGFGSTPGCLRIGIRPDPAVESGKVEVVDCASIIHTVDYNLDAFVSTSGDCGCPVATQTTNWSRIKALYK